MDDVTQTPKKPSFWQVIKAVSASMLGVQSQKNYQNDFSSHSAIPYLIVGVVFVGIFILGLLLLVNLVLL